MFCGFRFLLYHLLRLASDTALGMRRTDLCLSFNLNFLNCLLQVSSMHDQAAIQASSPQHHIPGPCRLLQTTLCDQLDNKALPRLWGSDVPTVPASSKHVTPWTVIGASSPKAILPNALIPATASQCLLLVMLASQHHLFRNMIF